MQKSLQRIASGMAQSFAAAHEVVKLVSPAILNFAKMTQEISIAMTPVLEAYGQLIESFSNALSQ